MVKNKRKFEDVIVEEFSPWATLGANALQIVLLIFAVIFAVSGLKIISLMLNDLTKTMSIIFVFAATIRLLGMIGVQPRIMTKHKRIRRRVE